MVRIDCRPGDKLIKQGDVGDNFYVVQSVRAPHSREPAASRPINACSRSLARAQGEFDIMVSQVGKVAHASAGNSFGELSLIQNQPRAATVRGARVESLSLTRRAQTLD